MASDWKYTNRCQIGIAQDGQASLLFQVLPPGDQKLGDVEDVAKLGMPLTCMRDLHAGIGRLLLQWDRALQEKASASRSAAEETAALLERAATHKASTGETPES